MRIKSLVITAVLATAILCSGSIASAQTDTQTLIAQLQAQIASLMAQIQALQAQAPTWCHTFNTNLGIGSTNSEVVFLAQALSKQNITGFTYTGGDVAKFDEKMASAVSAFQQRYASEILTPSGLKYPTGYVGPSTRKKLNALYGCGITTCPGELPNCPIGTSPQSYIGTDGCTHWNCVPQITQCQTDANCPTIYCVKAPCPMNKCVNGKCVWTYADSSITINSVSGPNSLNVGQTGTWAVNATAPSGTNLTYLVDWGDVVYPTGVGVGSANINQTSTFTHSYSQTGTYTIRFKVIDSNVCTVTASCDKSAQASITVVVGSATQCYTDVDCPTACTACPAGSSTATCGGCITYKCVSGKCVANTTPSITVISPYGGEQFTAGQAININWRSTGVNNVMIELQKASPNQAWVLSYSVPASQGSFSWTVPSTAPTVPMGSDYKIAIWDTTNGRIVDSSDNYFSIVPAAQPTCTDSDNGKDYFTKGTTVGLYWQDTVNKYPQTYYDSCSACDANMQNCRNVSEYFCRYDGKVDNVEYTCPNGCLNGACVSTTQPSITVTSPNGGETWQVGNTYTLRWTSANITPNTPVNIDLIPEVITPSQGPDRIGSDYSNSMGWNWQIPVGLTGRYLIQVTCQSPAVCSDRSDMPFTIVTPTTTCTDSDEGSNYYTKGTVTSPNGVSRTDYCTNEPWGSYIANLIEYYCVNGSEASYGYVCPNGCSNGACI